MNSQLAYASRTRTGVVTRSPTRPTTNLGRTTTENRVVLGDIVVDEGVIASLQALSILDVSANTSTTNQTISPLEDSNLLKHILSFVGDKQYRFIASISKTFQSVYVHLFPENNKSTYINASTIKHAKICTEECRRIPETATGIMRNLKKKRLSCAIRQHDMDVSRHSCTYARMVFFGIALPVVRLLNLDTYTCCSICAKMVVHGMNIRAITQRGLVT
jgi:hypothetical protein